MTRWCFVLFVGLLVGCQKAAPPDEADKIGGAVPIPGEEHKTIAVEGVNYDYLVYTPFACQNTPCPVMIGLHGRGGTMDTAMGGFEMIKMADEHKAIAIAPQGQDKRWHDAEKSPEHDRDIKLFDALYDQLPALHGDPNRVYLIGHSNGASEAFYWACERSNKVAAVVGTGASIAALDSQWQFQMLPNPTRHVSVLMIHGMIDPISGYDLKTYTLDIPTAIEWWAKEICPGAKEETKEIGKSNDILDRHWVGSDKAEVELMAYKNLGHYWPTSLDKATGISTSDKIWSFLSPHSLSGS